MHLRPLLGVVPAAGRARRLGAIPCSKEILPVAGPGPRPGVTRVASHCLLELMATAGVRRCYVVIGDGKWDIPAFLGDGDAVGVDLAYLTISNSPDTPSTLDRARRHVRGCAVAMGFPDVVLAPADALARVARRYDSSDADAVLGLLPATDPTLADMVEVDAEDRVKAVVPKPSRTSLELTWMLAVWGPTFSDYLHERVVAKPDTATELYVGDVLQAAIDDGLDISGEVIADGRYRDIGTPSHLAAALRTDFVN